MPLYEYPCDNGVTCKILLSELEFEASRSGSIVPRCTWMLCVIVLNNYIYVIYRLYFSYRTVSELAFNLNTNVPHSYYL